MSAIQPVRIRSRAQTSLRISAIALGWAFAAATLVSSPARASGVDQEQVQSGTAAPSSEILQAGAAMLSAAPDESPTARRAVSPVFSSLPAGTERYFLIAGYADATVAISDQESQSGGTFFTSTLNPALYFQYGSFLLLESEAEIEVDEEGETQFALEYAQLDLLVHDNVTVVVGKFLSPVGQFQERLHPSWINRLADAPAGFGHEGLQPGSEVGVQVRGGVPIGDARFTYAVALGNGPRLAEHGLALEGFGGDDNGNKAISGRLAFLPRPHLELGASFLRARVRGLGVAAVGHDESPEADPAMEDAAFDGPNLDLTIWGLDAAYTRGPWDLRFEYLRGTRDAQLAMDGDTILPRLRMSAWYAQAAYRLSGITQRPILEDLEPVVRYGEYKISGLEELEEEAEEERWDVGLNYWFAPSIVLHGAIQRRLFTGRGRDEDRSDTRFLFQLSYGF